VQYENTRIYQRAIELVVLAQRTLNELPTGYAFLADQLKRAVCSVPLNFAEGYAKGSAKEQRRFFRIARGSACEVAAIFDVAHVMGVMGDGDYEQGKDICDHLARMLTRFRA
jgi:four helix bundle protein